MLLTLAHRRVSRALHCAAVLCALLPGTALAQRSTTSEALNRMEETLIAREEDGVFSRQALQPVIVVSAAPAFEETRAWFPTAALASLIRVFGTGALRSCEACMAPRVYVEGQRLEQNVAALTIAEIIRIDEGARGTSAPVRTAIWLDESIDGVSLRVVELSTSRVIYAENFDPRLNEVARTERNFRLTRELERRTRGDSLSHVFIDAAVYPGQHISIDWTEQWGDDNKNLSGVTLSAVDPILGVGACYYRVIPEAWNLSVGGQVLVSLPTALVAQLTGDSSSQVIDPLLTGAIVLRLPIASSNYGIVAIASTNGQIGLGISLLNFSLLPWLP